LLAATTTARAIWFVESSLNSQVTRRILWSASKCVIAQIESGKIQAPYVNNRVKEINKEPKLEIRYIPSKQNPADIPSRGATIDELPELWRNGPKFLTHEQNQWPRKETIEMDSATETENEIADDTINLNVVTQEETLPVLDICPQKFHSLDRFLTCGALCIRFLAAKMPKFAQRFPEAIKTPKTLFLQWCLLYKQHRCYAAVFQNLHDQKFDPLVKKFRLQIDQNSLLRSRGRFQLHPVPDSIHFPVRKTKYSHLTRMIITGS